MRSGETLLSRPRDLEIVGLSHLDSCVSLEMIIWTLSRERGPFLKHFLFELFGSRDTFCVSLSQAAEYVNTAEALLRDDGHHCDRNVLICGVPGVGP